MKGKNRGLIFMYYPDIRLEGLKKDTKNVSHGGWSRRNSNQELIEVKTFIVWVDIL